jgi:hypothetical protein
MTRDSQLTQRELIKVACLKYCIDCGLDTDQLEPLFRRAAARLRKEAALGSAAGALLSSLGGAAVLTVPAVALGSTALGYGIGRQLGNTAVGDLPAVEDIHATDEIATLERERDAIIQRILQNRRKRTESEKPSVRRLFN